MGSATANPDGSVVIVGAGHAGVTAASSLRENGWSGAIHLLGSESGAPYQRPPLSKGFLSGAETAADLILRTQKLLEKETIVYRDGVSVRAINRKEGTIAVDDEVLGYDQLVLATGSVSRRLEMPGSQARGIFTLRSHRDAVLLRDALERAKNVVILGGGFLGFELASFAVTHCNVTVLERSDQILSRVVSEPIARSLADYHRRRGVVIKYRAGIAELDVKQGEVRGVLLLDGSWVAADTVIVTIGATPNTDLASQAGLLVEDGIMVDHRLCTSDPAIRAIGDCARHPSVYAEGHLRIESVQNAVDQARHVAKDLVSGREGGYRAVPWFWSRQSDRNLQIAGIAAPGDGVEVVAGVDDAGKLTVHRLRKGSVVAVETVNSPSVHIRARRLLAASPANTLVEADVR